jgi:hypothetical protein
MAKALDPYASGYASPYASPYAGHPRTPSLPGGRIIGLAAFLADLRSAPPPAACPTDQITT